MKHYINDVEVTPNNIFDIGISVDFEANVDQNKVTTDTITLKNEGAKIVKDHINTIGLLEGLPYDIEFAPNKKLGCYIDFVDNCVINDKSVQFKVKNRYGHDQFFDRAEGLIFDLVNQTIPFDTHRIDFQVIPKDNITQAIVASICTFAVSDAIARQVKEVSENASNLGNACLPIPILGIPPTITFDYGSIINASIKLAVSIAYLAILVSEAIILGIQLWNLINPITRSLKGCTALELMKKSCTYLGYEFQSSILENEYSNLVILPIPLNKTDTKWYDKLFLGGETFFNNGYPSINDTIPTLGTLINALETMFNGKTRVINGVVQFERWDYYFSKANQQISSSLVLQTDRLNEYKFDFSRLFKRYVINFQTDYSDYNTLDNFENTESEYSLDLNNPTDYRLNIIKGLTEKSIPFSLGKIKVNNSWIDEIMKGLFKVVDFLAGTDYASKDFKKGVLQLTDVWFSTTKCFMWDGAYGMSLDTQNKLYPTYLWDNFHYINNPLIYQYIIKENVKIAMSGDEFVKILNLNYVEIDGKLCEIMKIDYFDGKSFANVTYKEPRNIFENQISLTKIY